MGIKPGVKVSAAYALAEHLIVKEQDQEAEQAALEKLAAWAGQFSSWVSLQLPHSVLLEIQGSLQLFKGLQNLLKNVQSGVAELGYVCRQAAAPTPAAAELLARAGEEIAITQMPQLANALSRLPIQYLDVTDKTIDALHGLGLRTIIDVQRLPRDGIQRRFGVETLHYLDRLMGQRADVRPHFEAPSYFRRRVELPAAVENNQALLFVGRRLLLELAGFLRARCMGTAELSWILHHEKGAKTRFELRLVAPTRDLNHLHNLLRERLERLTLVAPVYEVELHVEHLVLLEENTEPLLHSRDEKTARDWQPLVERLVARLGRDAISGLQMVADHRPEWAWRYCAPGENTPMALDFEQRPLWLLDNPQRLEIRQQQLYRQGYLRLLVGPERIESGWWDKDVQRDYFIAENTQGQRYWIFREIGGEGKWYVHGIF